jgi:hypothetical protein
MDYKAKSIELLQRAYRIALKSSETVEAMLDAGDVNTKRGKPNIGKFMYLWQCTMGEIVRLRPMCGVQDPKEESTGFAGLGIDFKTPKYDEELSNN